MECEIRFKLKDQSKNIEGDVTLFAFSLLPFPFSSASLRGHCPEQVHRVNSQLWASLTERPLAPLAYSNFTIMMYSTTRRFPQDILAKEFG